MDLIKEGANALKEGVKIVRTTRKWLGKKHSKDEPKKKSKDIMTKGIRNIGGENKRVDIKIDEATPLVAIATVAGAQTFATGMMALNLCQTGVGDYQRVGNKCTFTSTQISFELVKNAASNQNVRCLVVYDDEPGGAYPALEKIIKTTDQTGGENTGFNSMMNLHNTDRFKVLRNITYSLDENKELLNIKMFIKNKYSTQYSGTANPLTISSVIKGTVYLIMFYSGANAPSIQNLYIRSKYSDK